MENCKTCKGQGCCFCSYTGIENADRSESAVPTGSIAVPVEELKKLEETRLEIYHQLEGAIGGIALHELTWQIWKVANTKRW